MGCGGMGRGGCRLFLLPEGRRNKRQRDEGARVEIFGELAPSSDPSGHLLPGGEKKPCRDVRLTLLSDPIEAAKGQIRY